ncbi:MAG: hypothetical protein H6721_10035 [Sandaracinus sp.]|nr:hypothetical protein [Sandaracinus sp.]
MKNEKRIARILLLKKREEDVRRAEVVQAAARVREVEEVYEERRRHEAHLHEVLGRTRDVDASELQATSALLAEHRRSLTRVTEALRERREEHEARHGALAEAARSRFALERRRHALLEAKRAREARVEQEALDDVARRGGRG